MSAGKSDALRVAIPQLGELASIEGRYSGAPGGQSSGWHSYVVKDLRRLAGEKVRAPFRNRYCGGGNPTPPAPVGRGRTPVWAPPSGSRRCCAR